MLMHVDSCVGWSDWDLDKLPLAEGMLKVEMWWVGGSCVCDVYVSPVKQSNWPVLLIALPIQVLFKSI